ncbi:hypothetical protein N657DRAFT_645326 [Parathielavia appendiculata]|uniref:Uncharacterized protein n=1 Tax=Parathielavia appendiculata TaxID=2587402 RepID=A0AAN6TZP8_9PEZI|nr:hypothetical protein N657DRAFT_645326 [Parathielavia appendiculata]
MFGRHAPTWRITRRAIHTLLLNASSLHHSFDISAGSRQQNSIVRACKLFETIRPCHSFHRLRLLFAPSRFTTRDCSAGFLPLVGDKPPAPYVVPLKAHNAYTVVVKSIFINLPAKRV